MNPTLRRLLLAPMPHYRSISGLLTEWDLHDPRNGGVGLADGDGITICENLVDPRRAFFDPFTRGDSALTMGTDWEVLAGTWGITSNQAYLVTATGTDYVVRDSGLSDCVVSATLATYALSSRLSFRFSDVDNGYIIEPSATKYELYKREAASFSLLGSYVAAPVNGDRIQVVLNGSSINVFFNGTSRIAVTDTFNQTATKHGFGGNTNSVAGRWDDFIVAKLTDAAQTTAANKFTYKTAIQNGRSVARVAAASSQRMNIAQGNLLRNVSGATIYAVANRTSSATVGHLFFASTNSASATRASIRYNASDIPEMGARRLDADSVTLVTGVNARAGAFSIIVGTFNYAEANGTLVVDGATENTAAVSTAGSTSDTDSALIQIGAGNTLEFFGGDLAKILVYNGTHTTMQQRHVLRSLRRESAIELTA